MKIYSKTNFLFGIFFTAISIFNFTISLLDPDPDSFRRITDPCFAFVLLLYGIGLVLRSFSEKASQEDFAQANDPRNVLITYKTNTTMLHCMLGMTVLLMVISLAGYIFSRDSVWIALLLPPSILFLSLIHI